MSYPPVPSVAQIADHFIGAVSQSTRAELPFRRWKMQAVFPEALCTAILVLPIAPPLLGHTDGTRASYNHLRTFITPGLQRDFPVCAALTDALQRPDVARVMAETCNIDVADSYLRMEYMQDLDGAWLEPHRDIPEKLFSMVVYLFTGPEAKEWGTDIYDAQKRWVARSPGTFNSGVIFVAGPATWHGFEPRPIIGVRRLMEINYVRHDWRDRDQLASPEHPIRLSTGVITSSYQPVADPRLDESRGRRAPPVMAGLVPAMTGTFLLGAKRRSNLVRVDGTNHPCAFPTEVASSLRSSQ